MVQNKADGYPTDVHYPAFFYKEMQPLWLTSVARFLGFTAPDMGQAFRFCELGCGVGLNLLVAAACHPQAQFVGVDINASQLDRARAAADAAGLQNITFQHAAFTALSRSMPAQSFDFMCTHGVWSWVAPQQQKALLECVQHGLKPHGIFYLHYMCHPGSTDLVALQHFLHLFAPHVPGSSAQQAQTGLKLLRQLADRGMFHDKPGLLQRLKNLQGQDPRDLAHEFLTDHWQPQHSAQMHQQAAGMGLCYLGSADVFNNLDVSLSIPGNLQSVVRQTKLPAVAETLKDMARNSHQRMDIFQRHPQPLEPGAHLQQLSEMVFQRLPRAPDSAPLSFATPIGTIEGPSEICTALLQRLEVGPAAFAELSQLPAFAGQAGLLLQTLQLMMLAGIVHPSNRGATSAVSAQQLQQWLAQQCINLQVLPECGTAVPTAAAS